MLIPIASFEPIELSEANSLLEKWEHKMGPLRRGNQGAWCHALLHNNEPVAVTTASYLIAAQVGGAPYLTRENTVELSRLCAARSGLCRVALRMWREFVFPTLKHPEHGPFKWAVSYQDADLHNGNTYRNDGWSRMARSRSGPDTRSGRPGRDKWVWVYPEPKLEAAA